MAWQKDVAGAGVRVNLDPSDLNCAWTLACVRAPPFLGRFRFHRNVVALMGWVARWFRFHRHLHSILSLAWSFALALPRAVIFVRPTSDGRDVSPLPFHTECTVRFAPPRTPSFRIVGAESDRHTTTSAGFVVRVLVGCFYNAWIRRFIRCVPFRVLPNARRTWCFSSLVPPLPFRTALSKASWRRFLSLCIAWRRSPPVLPSLSGRRLGFSWARGTRRRIPPRARRLPRSSSSHPRILSHDTSTRWIDVGFRRSSTTTSVVDLCSISRIDGSTVAWSLPSLRSCVLLLLSLSHDLPLAHDSRPRSDVQQHVEMRTRRGSPRPSHPRTTSSETHPRSTSDRTNGYEEWRHPHRGENRHRRWSDGRESEPERESTRDAHTCGRAKASHSKERKRGDEAAVLVSVEKNTCR